MLSRSTLVAAVLSFFLLISACWSAAAQDTGVRRPQKLVSVREGEAIVRTSLQHRRIQNKPDCSHFVHDVYADAGLNYQQSSSRELYAGIDSFQRVEKAQPGDLVVWAGHVGIVVDPEDHSFYSSVLSGLSISNYDSNYWKSRGVSRFYRYKINALQSARMMTGASDHKESPSSNQPPGSQSQRLASAPKPKMVPASENRLVAKGATPNHAVPAENLASAPKPLASTPKPKMVPASENRFVAKGAMPNHAQPAENLAGAPKPKPVPASENRFVAKGAMPNNAQPAENLASAPKPKIVPASENRLAAKVEMPNNAQPAENLASAPKPKIVPASENRLVAKVETPNNTVPADNSFTANVPTSKSPSLATGKDSSAAPVSGNENGLREPVLVSSGRMPTREDVRLRMNAFMEVGAEELLQMTAVNRPIEIVDVFDVDTIETHGKFGLAQLKIKTIAFFGDSGVSWMNHVEQVQLALEQQPEGWIVFAPPNRVYLSRQAAVKYIAQRIATLSRSPRNSQQLRSLTRALGILLGNNQKG